jgi:hypothetical protein
VTVHGDLGAAVLMYIFCSIKADLMVSHISSRKYKGLATPGGGSIAHRLSAISILPNPVRTRIIKQTDAREPEKTRNKTEKRDS